MDARAIVDTGFVVALLNGNDSHHEWAASLVPKLRGPWLTAEACVSEAVFLLEDCGWSSVERLFDWIRTGLIVGAHVLPERLDAVCAELFRYRSRWVDLADASIVLLSDEKPRLPVVTVDVADFSVYFRSRRRRRLLMP
jgi:predicted nucleic acid-binding protein